jgi:DNA repair protein RecN (Recombination protein N)
LGLALGLRAERGLVRAGCEQAKVIAVFSPDQSHPVWQLLASRDVDVEPSEELILRRTVSTDGKSRAFLNDMPVSAALLRDVGNLLVEIHGQHDGRGLMDVRTHIASLDAYAGLDAPISACAKAWQAWDSAKREASELERQASADASEQIYLSEAAAELDRLDPKAGEEQQLAALRAMMMQTEALLGDIESARTSLESGPGVDGQLGTALRHVEQALTRFTPAQEPYPAETALGRALAALERAMVELDEAGEALQGAARHLQLEPEQLEQAEERLFSLRALARKHRVEVDQLEQIRQDLAARLDALENLEQAQKQAAAKVQETREIYLAKAQALSQKRQKGAKRLDKAILKELAPLRMEKAKFRTAIEQVDPDAGTRAGLDKVQFEISANPGMPLGPLASIASGGELSRISLAIKAAMDNQGGPSVMVFDEIDQGVGGAVADAVGRRLAKLSEDTQVLVITHSPQVAARANAQYQIEKTDKNNISRTHVHRLAPAEREEEIARMLAGADITDEAREAAKVLIG